MTRIAQRYALLAAWAVIVAVFCILRPDTFGTTANLQLILGSQAVVLMLTVGLIVPLRCGDFDLSVAFVMALSAMLVAKLNVDAGWSLGPAILAALAVGVLAGAFNALVVVGMGVDSFISTLGSGTLCLGITQWISGSSTVTGLSRTLSDATVGTRLFGVSLSFWYGVAICLILWVVLDRTVLGRRILFVGRSRSVARLSGIGVSRVRVGAFLVSGLIAAFAGVVYAGTNGGADPAAGQGFLLPVFAAAFLGATTVVPGRFNIWGTFIAVYFLVTGITGLQLLGVESFVQNVFYGLALIAALGLARFVERRQVDEETVDA